MFHISALRGIAAAQLKGRTSGGCSPGLLWELGELLGGNAGWNGEDGCKVLGAWLCIRGVTQVVSH
jgi:hypothetical protein